MIDKDRQRILEQASVYAHQIIGGEITPKTGCARIAEIPGALDVSELNELAHLAHLQNGDHDEFGFSAESCASAIITECKTLLVAIDLTAL